MENTQLTLGLLAAAIHVVAYFIYNLQARSGKSKPKASSWSIWTLLAGLNALTYNDATNDVYATFQFFAGSVACFLTFLYLLVTHRFGWPGKKELKIFAICIAAIVVWQVFHSASWANLIVLLALVVSFKPTLDAVLADPDVETPLSWVLWTTAFAITIANKSIGWDGAIIGFIMPSIAMLVHGSVAVLSRKARKLRFKKETS